MKLTCEYIYRSETKRPARPLDIALLVAIGIMDTPYKEQLVRKLDGLTALERSGYGIPREREDTGNWRGMLEEIGTALLASAALILWTVLILIAG